ncbi:hypothetical protein [Pseudoxanthomonas composti]|nr:hypothetical protein [Pseudoxanthomonas composti]
MQLPTRPLTLALAATVLASLPASSAPSQAPQTQVWIDVATHTMAGMPDLGFMGGLASRMAGKDGAPRLYPQSRGVPGMPGRLLDIAMLNQRQPGTPASQLIPAGMDMGDALPLLPPEVPPSKSESVPGKEEDVEVTIRQYWGCGDQVRPGQPKQITIKASQGQVQTQGELARGLFVPDRDVHEDARYALWPNQRNRARVSERSSLVGQHRITGAGVPESLQFQLDRNADFMPKLMLEARGSLADSIQLQWPAVERARGYFLFASGAQDPRTLVMWSSAEVPGAGPELLDYLGGGNIERWLAQKVLLPTTTTRCAIPQGIFKSQGGQRDRTGVASLSMIAYGPETNLVWPPKPADPKLPWHPEWNVRVRTKSTSTAMLGMDLTDASSTETPEADAPPKEEESGTKKLLRGLLRKL